MATARFRIVEHTYPAAHIRQYSRATADDQEVELRIAAKQYIPLEESPSSRTKITIIGAHANGLPKEIYEPLWDDLHDSLSSSPISIRSIWITDVAQQGVSGLLNSRHLGNEPSWSDHPRDLLQLVNHFRGHMKRPLVGIAHSMGACALVDLSLAHPRLFGGLILLEPVIERESIISAEYNPAKWSAGRRERWGSFREAEGDFGRSRLCRGWDPRALRAYLSFGLRRVHAREGGVGTEDGEWTLMTTRDQEVATFLRRFAEDDGEGAGGLLFDRPEPIRTYRMLPYVKPSVFYVLGGRSPMAGSHERVVERLHITGTGDGGSGGAAKGRVKMKIFPDAGHFLPLERVKNTAEECKEWLVKEMERWMMEEEKEREEWKKVDAGKKGMLSEEYRNDMAKWTGKGREKL